MLPHLDRKLWRDLSRMKGQALAVALVIFLLAVVASGISVLWNATESPTPLLLSFAAACFVLVNAVVSNGDAEASGNRVLRWAALVLALAILPLALLAAMGNNHPKAPAEWMGAVTAKRDENVAKKIGRAHV